MDEPGEEKRLTPAQQALVASALHEVSGAARRLAPRLRKHLSFDELMSLGRTGLVEAALAYDPAQNDSFPRFARYRIRGAMLDGYLREAQEQDRVLALCMRGGYEYVARRRRQGDVMTDADGKAEERLLDHVDGLAASVFATAAGMAKPATGEEALSRRQVHERAHALLRSSLARLTPREAEVVSMHYVDGRPLKEVGAALRIPHPGAYRVHDRAIVRLGKLVRAAGLTEPPPREDEL
ncbi:sigma-70 family RNA polymerase sigma factor [Sorangium sp. So ce1151]|uniref:sigma-70 family RNA polymerase sigma factor n=1 Tax=Sorangium sp. So ce1151 TaxID=3133332 RepID=UPI002BADD797|nr:sigma-70 family RNA polymerase sigma factor [Sorangium sp.]